MAKRYHATKKFAKLATMHEEGAPASAFRKMSDTWVKRKSSNVTGFYRDARPEPCIRKSI